MHLSGIQTQVIFVEFFAPISLKKAALIPFICQAINGCRGVAADCFMFSEHNRLIERKSIEFRGFYAHATKGGLFIVATQSPTSCTADIDARS